MAAHTGDSFQKVMYISPVATSEVHVASTAGSENLNPPLASKAGISFVIPKNKLCGALVPVARNLLGKWDSKESKKEQEVKFLPKRKTRWGIDVTQHPAIKKGKALALQTRAEQISTQLETGQFDIDMNEATRSRSPPPVYDPTGQRINTREGRRREQLEVEKREAIGECLLLNPFYKPPAGYKPVYKEAKLYIPETGSKIAIRGRGAVKEGKKSNPRFLQGGRPDGKEPHGAFEDLHVHITADTMEKVDAAVALIEPLLTPVDEKVLDKEYLIFLEELGDGSSGARALSKHDLSSKLSTGKGGKGDHLAISTTSTTTMVFPIEIYETYVDPNQLDDIISAPHPMLITTSKPQQKPSAWSLAKRLSSTLEARLGAREKGFVMNDFENQIHSPPNGLKVPLASFRYK